jgi:hypothetical protein
MTFDSSCQTDTSTPFLAELNMFLPNEEYVHMPTVRYEYSSEVNANVVNMQGGTSINGNLLNVNIFNRELQVCLDSGAKLNGCCLGLIKQLCPEAEQRIIPSKCCGIIAANCSRSPIYGYIIVEMIVGDMKYKLPLHIFDGAISNKSNFSGDILIGIPFMKMYGCILDFANDTVLITKMGEKLMPSKFKLTAKGLPAMKSN